MKILVVDDERFNLEVAKDIISHTTRSDNIILCNSPKEVLSILSNYEIDVIILDIVMPEINGLELLKRIREKNEWDEIQILMYTSLKDKEHIKLCFESGADDYINKPVDETEFLARLKTAIKKRQNSQDMRQMYEKLIKQNKELKTLAQQLKETKLHMIQKETLASLGELAAGIAHEINNPIGYVGSNIETLGKYTNKIKVVMEQYKGFIHKLESKDCTMDALLEEKAKILELEKTQKIELILTELDGIFKDCRDGIERVTKIVQTFRSYARTSTEEEMVRNDLNNIVDETLLIIRNEAKYTIDIVTEPGHISMVTCNKIKIGQVILNVMLNAIQAIKGQNRVDRGKIIVKTYNDDEYIYCRITDDGPGIKTEHLNRVFDPFFTTKEVGKGTGLGLSISYDIIVNKHKGDFFVESQEGCGATFTIRLPIDTMDSM